ncbi:MAG: hypothetical protein NTZ13_03075 [Candidatus Parcubacteria bacterium]|nr:hypothetical protein [Candidatus Parcubacteria bacterium]
MEKYEEKRDKYEFFDYPEEREELFRYTEKIVEYLKNEKISNLVIIDRSSRPFYVAVLEYWHKKYSGEPAPNIYFMNPKGFKPREEMTEAEIYDIYKDSLWKDDVCETPEPQEIKSREEVLKEFQDTYKKLLEDKKKPVLIFDTCIHSGNSLASVKNTFDDAGFTDARVGAINPSDKGAKVSTDFYVSSQRPEKGCYPFDRDRLIEKTFDHVYSSPTMDPRKKEKAIQLRKEIKRIIADKMNAET